MFYQNKTRGPLMPLGCSTLLIILGVIFIITPLIEIIAQILGLGLIFIGITLLTFNLIKKIFL
ncbi:MAG TPA: hypothetical protein DEZ08_05185 [Dehalococcoidia bacterium]|nr:hypothetical protein [Dehalococcoidia bacterium]